ncbi:hypothetical protein Tco_1385861 [Tanacetum coccineum]
MADLEFINQHNMVACLEKMGENLEFHEIMDFLTSSLIHHALTVSPTIYISYIKQFWNTASSQTVNDEKQIHATVDSKAVVITETSIRSSLLLNDADGTACLTNEAIFQNLALMGYEVPHQAPKGEGSDQPPVTASSTSHDTTQDSRDSLEGTNGSEWDQVQPSHDNPLSGDRTSEKVEGGLNLEELFSLCTNLSNRVLALETSKDAQATKILKLKDQIKKLKRKCKPSISHYRAWLKSVKRLSIKKKLGRKESVSKQGRKNAKPELNLDAFDDLDADGRDYMEIEDVVKERRQNKGSGDKSGSTKELVSTAVPKTVSTARPELSTARPDVNAARQEDSAVEPRPPPTTTSIFDDDDITMAQTLIKMKEEKAKEKGVSIKDIEDS